MRHSMDFDDTYYYVDVMDDIVSDFVKETSVKDKLLKLLKDEPLDKLNALIKEDFHQMLISKPDPARRPSKGKLSGAKRWWKQVTTLRRKPLVSPATPFPSTQCR